MAGKPLRRMLSDGFQHEEVGRFPHCLAERVSRSLGVGLGEQLLSAENNWPESKFQWTYSHWALFLEKELVCKEPIWELPCSFFGPLLHLCLLNLDLKA